ncbi:hypothetical protein LSUE1_G003360 [Lachnellula suecica]|uniref:NAD(P)-binding domain-containing protein n=1 Tax=Lachnellula suecica TaxID=602035 RepID=A0A8T9C644_9HELO|nr:hypothetical protein LSUE1_G003360 [Lachnellula suecica]
MSPKYAKDQPAGFSNRIENVAIIGAGGHVGKHFAEELLKTGKHTVTALTRMDSQSTFPEGVKVARIDYDNEESIVSALKGQQFFVITLPARSQGAHSTLVNAAAKAGVPYVMANIYGYDIHNKRLNEASSHGQTSLKYCAEIESLGVSSWVAMICGYWYEWSLALPPPWFGFDIKAKKVTFYDDGKTRVNVSTWIYCGKALAGLLSLKELPEDENDESLTVSRWKNKPLYISSFKVCQRDMLDSIHRLTGTTDKDWEIEYEPSDVRYKNGNEQVKNGDWLGFPKAMYARVFFPNGDGNFESTRGLENALLGLPKDDLDEATKRTLEMVESGWTIPGLQGR